MATKKKSSGTKHRIIFIRHSLNRVWRNLLVFDIVLWGLWWAAPYVDGAFFRPPYDVYLMLAGWLFLVLIVVALLLRNTAYVQARAKFVLIKLPFTSVKVPYENVEAVRMVLYKNIFDKKGLSWADKRFMRPYKSKTMVTLNLNKYPGSQFLLRLLVPGYMFLPDEKGFLLHTKYYLDFNTEVDSRLNEARVFSADQPSRKVGKKEEEEVYNGYFNLFDDD